MSGYTPGPWLAAPKPSSVVGWPIVAPSAQGRLICSLNYASAQAEFGPQDGDIAFNKEAKANGALIAAAPELLASVIELLEPLERASAELAKSGKYLNGEGEDAFDRARAAITKATGGAS